LDHHKNLVFNQQRNQQHNQPPSHLRVHPGLEWEEDTEGEDLPKEEESVDQENPRERVEESEDLDEDIPEGKQ